MNFSDKSLVVSGCSFTSGGGLDNPNYWDFLFPNINKEDYLLNDYPIQPFYDEIVDKNNYVYFLSEVAGFKEYYNLSEGAAGVYSTIQRLYRFIKDNPKKDMFVIYQPPAYNRVEMVVNGKFKSLWTLKDTDKMKFHLFYKNFYDDIFYFYKSILEIDNLTQLCKSKNIDYLILDWDGFYDLNGEFFIEKIAEYKNGKNKNYSDHIGWFSNKYEMWEYDFKTIVSEWKYLNLKEFWIEDAPFGKDNSIKYKISKDKKILDGHLSPFGAKKLSEFIFRKINPKKNLI